MTRLEQLALGAGLLILFTSLLFAAGLGGTFAIVVAAALCAALATFGWVRAHLPHARVWLVPLVLAGCATAALLLLALTRPANALNALAVPATAAGSLATLLVLRWDRARCDLCNRRLRTQSVVFHCPRCRLHVCEESCWAFEHRRCRLCLEQRVPVLPVEDRWWTRGTGPRYEQGRCQVCLAGAAGTDLRPCPHCRRLQCRDCWDHANGACARCGGALPNLPESLTMAVANVTE